MLFSICSLTQKRLKFSPSFFFSFDIQPVVGLLLLASLWEHGGKGWNLTSANREFAQGDLRRYSSSVL